MLCTCLNSAHNECNCIVLQNVLIEVKVKNNKYGSVDETGKKNFFDRKQQIEGLFSKDILYTAREQKIFVIDKAPFVVVIVI